MSTHSTPSSTSIPDVQGAEDRRQLAINKVGIKSIRHPVRVGDRHNDIQHTVRFQHVRGLAAQFQAPTCRVSSEILNSYDREISVENFEPMLREMVPSSQPRPAISR